MIEEHVRAYLHKIRHFPMLEKEEEHQLAKSWKDSKDQGSLDRLVESHMKLVAKIAHGYKGYGLPLTDMLAEGHVGLMQAMHHFDPDLGYRLSSYVTTWIRSQIQDYVLRAWSLVRLGKQSLHKKLFFKLRRASEDLSKDGELNLDELAQKLDVSKKDILYMQGRLHGKDVSLNTAQNQDDDREWIEFIEDEAVTTEMTLIHQQEWNERRRLLKESLTVLSAQEHHIFTKRRLQEPPKTLQELSLKLGISSERVRQVEEKCFEKIRKRVRHLVISKGMSQQAHDNRF